MDQIWLGQTKPREGRGFARALMPANSANTANALAEAERRADPRYPCDFAARVASANRVISTAGRIVNISGKGARVEVMFPRRGPSAVMLHDRVNDNLYECQVRWRTDDFIGVRFIDILGPGRRRQYFAGEDLRLTKTDRGIIDLAEPPWEYVLAEPPPPRWFAVSPLRSAITAPRPPRSLWRPRLATAAPPP